MPRGCLWKTLPDLALQAQAEKRPPCSRRWPTPTAWSCCAGLPSPDACGDPERELGIRQPPISQQLAVLRQEGLVQTRKEGKHVFYRLASEDAAAVLPCCMRACAVTGAWRATLQR